MLLEERNTMVLELFRYLSQFQSYLRKTVNLTIAFFLGPHLEGSRYDLKRSTRVPLDSKHLKESFGLCSTVLYQLGAKWHGGLHPHVRSRMGKQHVRARVNIKNIPQVKEVVNTLYVVRLINNKSYVMDYLLTKNSSRQFQAWITSTFIYVSANAENIAAQTIG